GAHILADLVDDENDMLLAGALADDVDHFLNAIVHEVDDITGRGGESVIVAEERRVEPMRDARQQAVYGQFVVLIVSPFLTGFVTEDRLELLEASLLLEPSLERGYLQVTAVSGVLQHLVVEDGRDLSERRSRDLLARQVEHDHRCRKARRDG